MQVELEQRIITKFLTKENMDTHEILAKLQAYLEDKAYALRTVRFWMGEVRRDRKDLRDEHRSGRLPLDHIDTQILHTFASPPLSRRGQLRRRSTPRTALCCTIYTKFFVSKVFISDRFQKFSIYT
jgi:hypothetical protein